MPKRNITLLDKYHFFTLFLFLSNDLSDYTKNSIWFNVIEFCSQSCKAITLKELPITKMEESIDTI